MADVVERHIPHTNITKDWGGFGDILALDNEPGALLIQACITSDMSTRIKKIEIACRAVALAWLAAGNRIACWGWALRGKPGKRKLWTLKVYPVTRDTIAERAA